MSSIQAVFTPANFSLFLTVCFETELALNAIRDIGRKRLIDTIHPPFPHPQLRAPQKPRVGDAEPALMSLETFTIPCFLAPLIKS